MSNWKLEDECERFIEIVGNSGLRPIVDNSVINYDSETVSAFCERYYAETDTMHFGFGEMGLTPEDAHHTFKVKIDGKSTNEGYEKQLTFQRLGELCEELFRWSQNEMNSWYMLDKYGKPKREFNLVRLREEYSGTKKKEEYAGLEDHEVRAAAAAYLLYVLAVCVFPSSAGNRVNANFLQLLHPLDEVDEYSWGTTIVSHVNTALRKVSRHKTAQFNCNTSLLQVWIYEHFPKLMAANDRWIDLEKKAQWEPDQPRGKRYIFTGDQLKGKKNWYLFVRQRLDSMEAHEVVFDPYMEHRNKGKMAPREQICLYNGPLWHPLGHTMYDPSRIMRQVGYVQDHPIDIKNGDGKFKVDRQKSGADIGRINVVYKPKPLNQHWNERMGNLIDVYLYGKR